jgi:hypothetical protein
MKRMFCSIIGAMKLIREFSRFTRYAWVVLGYNLVVILWGAFVRASGSGLAQAAVPIGRYAMVRLFRVRPRLKQ